MAPVFKSSLLSVCLALLLATALARKGKRNWESAHATFYGGQNAAGTMGGACGYGNLYSAGYGVYTAAASVAMYGSGLICGTCFQVRCAQAGTGGSCSGKSVTVTVTNECPNGSEGGWCDAPKHHLDMAAPAWNVIGTNPASGWLQTEMRRVSCSRSGGISFSAQGNPWFTAVTVINVAGPGSIVNLEYSTNGGASWAAAVHDYGAVWDIKSMIGGKATSLRLTAPNHKTRLTIKNALPAGWSNGNIYKTNANFRRSPRRRTLEIVEPLGEWFNVTAGTGLVAHN